MLHDAQTAREQTAANPLRTVLLYSAGHIGSATIFNKLVDSPEFEIVAVVRGIRADAVSLAG